MAIPTLMLSAADFRIDHITIAGRDVRQMQARLSSVGIASVYGGAHSNRTTEMALASLPDGSYLELMGIVAGSDPELVNQNVWGKFLAGDVGPCAWALQSVDLTAEIARLKSAGVTVSAPAAGGRERPDGVRLDWETSDIGPEPRGTFFPFLIRDLTPRNLRALPQGKPATRDFRKISRIVIAVRSLDAAVARYRQAYGLPAPLKQVDREFGAHLAVMGGTPVVLAQPLNADSWLTGRLDRFGETPCAFVLAAARPEHYRAPSKSRWFGVDISWFDTEKLGWRLGFENAL